MKALGVKLNSFYQGVLTFFREFPTLLDRRHLVFVHDLVMSGVALILTFWIRISSVATPETSLTFSFYAKHTFVYMLVSACIFLWLQLYRGIWRYISTHEIMGVVFASAYAAALYFPLMVLMSTSNFVPRSSIFLLFATTSLLLLSTRVTYRFTQVRWFDDEEIVYQSKPLPRVILVGSFQEICFCLEALKKEQRPSFIVLGAISHKKDDVGRFFEGAEILGTSDDLEKIVTHFNLEDKHPHNLVLLGKESHNLKTFQSFATLLPKLGIGLMHFKQNNDNSFDLEPLSYKDLAVSDPQPLQKKHRPMSQTSLSKKRFLLFGADHSMGSDLSQKLLLQGNKTLYLSDFSAHFVSSFQDKLAQAGMEESTDYGHFLPLTGTNQEDFEDVINEANPDLVLAFPPSLSEEYFQNYPAKSIGLIRKYMFGILTACLSQKGVKVVFVLPMAHGDFTHRCLNRYYNILQAEMSQHLTDSKKKLDLFFLYTGDFAESPESLLSSIKTSLEQGQKPTISKSLKSYEFSSLERISEKIIDYLLRLYVSSDSTDVEAHLQPDMVSTPQELLDQIKALYPLPYKSQSIELSFTSDKANKAKLKPFIIQKSEKTGHYLIKNKPLLNEILTKLKDYVRVKEDKKILEILS